MSLSTWFVLGAGYTGTALARAPGRATASGVIVTRRALAAAERVAREVGARGLAASISAHASEPAIPRGAIVVCLAPPGRRPAREIAKLVALAARARRSSIYVSSTGVYAPGGGAWVDEQLAARAGDRVGQRARSRRRPRSPARSAIIAARGRDLRPGPRASSIALRAGTYRIIGDGSAHVSRIHVDDLVAAILARRRRATVTGADQRRRRRSGADRRGRGCGSPRGSACRRRRACRRRSVGAEVAGMLTADRRIANARMKTSSASCCAIRAGATRLDDLARGERRSSEPPTTQRPDQRRPARCEPASQQPPRLLRRRIAVAPSAHDVRAARRAGRAELRLERGPHLAARTCRAPWCRPGNRAGRRARRTGTPSCHVARAVGRRRDRLVVGLPVRAAADQRAVRALAEARRAAARRHRSNATPSFVERYAGPPMNVMPDCIIVVTNTVLASAITTSVIGPVGRRAPRVHVIAAVGRAIQPIARRRVRAERDQIARRRRSFGSTAATSTIGVEPYCTFGERRRRPAAAPSLSVRIEVRGRRAATW